MIHETAAKLKIFISMFIFGTIGVFKMYIPLPNSLIALARAVIGMVFLVIILIMTRKKPDWKAIRSNLLWLILSGVFLGYNWLLLFEAFDFTSVAIGTLCYYMAPIFVILVSPFLLREHLNLRKAICVTAALAGMVCISGVLQSAMPSGDDLKGILFGLAAAVLYASIILCNKQMKGISAYDKTILQLGISAVSMLPYCFFTVSADALSLDTKAILLLLLIGVVHTGLTYYLYFGSMEHVSGQSAAIISYIDPVIAVLASVLFLRQPMRSEELIGAVLIIGAALVSEVHIVRKKVGHD